MSNLASNNLLQRKRKLEENNWGSVSYWEQAANNVAKIIEKGTPNAFDEAVWKHFLKIVNRRNKKDIEDNPHNHLRLSHLTYAIDKAKKELKETEDKNIVNEITFIRTTKGNGKTWEQARLIRELCEKDPKGQVVLIRNTEAEVKFGLSEQLWRDEWFPIYMRGSQNKLYHKYETITKLSGETEPKPMGFCTYIRGSRLEAAQGGTWKNVKLIIWDECNYTGSAQSLNEQDLNRFLVFCSSIIRFNPEVRIYMFGNNLPLEDDKSDLIIDRMGLTTDVHFKRIPLDSKDKQHRTYLYYWNIPGGTYKGAETQAFMGLFGSKFLDDIASNNPAHSCDRYISFIEFVEAEPILAYVFTYEQRDMVLYLGKIYTDEKKEDCIYVVRYDFYNHKETYFYKCITDERNIYNKYYPRMILGNYEELQINLSMLIEICELGKVWYSGAGSDILNGLLLDKWQTKYKLDYLNSDWA